MTAPLSAEDFAHIRADVHNAVLEAQQHDPPVTMEILFRLLDAIGALASLDPWPVNKPYIDWATELLQDVQRRATTKVPYEAREYEYEYELTLDADERSGR